MELLIVFSREKSWPRRVKTLRAWQQGKLTQAFAPELLLGLDHILPAWLTFSLQPLLEVGPDTVWPKAPVINHIVRLSNGQSPQANKSTPTGRTF